MRHGAVGATAVARRHGRQALTLLAVVAATLAGGLGAMALYDRTAELSVGRIDLSAEPLAPGALDLYVPLVDWGVRFEGAVRAPVRLHVDLRTVDRRIVERVASGASFNVEDVRREAESAIRGYLIALILLATGVAAALGVLVALATRQTRGLRLRWAIGTAVATAILFGGATALLVPPRGAIDEPQYYAYGPDIPRALEAIEAAQRSTARLDQELDAQLVGLARLVTRPSERTPLQDRPQLTLASDLHNNVLALPVLQRATQGQPLFFAGDLTDRGSPLEARLVRRVADLGDPFVFVSGNHDSDSLQRDLAARGAIVLTQDGRLRPDGQHGELVVNVGGLRVAGYSDPFERRSADDFADRYEPAPSPALQDAFTAWLRPLLGRVDVVMVHEPALIESALAVLADEPPAQPIVFLVGHTHAAAIERFAGVTVLNGGSVGAGGTGNLAEPTDIGIARLIYTNEPRFQPLAADLVAIDPGTGSATARRERLDAVP